jgi:hypothetical protein
MIKLYEYWYWYWADRLFFSELKIMNCEHVAYCIHGFVSLWDDTEVLLDKLFLTTGTQIYIF